MTRKERVEKYLADWAKLPRHEQVRHYNIILRWVVTHALELVEEARCDATARELLKDVDFGTK